MRGNIKFMVVALSLLTALVVGLGIHTGATTIDKTRDCDKFAVIKCGTMTADELRAEYDSLNTSKANGNTEKQADIPAIFSALGISRADLNGSFVKGAVYQDGTVRIGNKIVAKNAKTAIRNVAGQAIAGSSTAKIVPTSKMGSAQEALIRLNANGQFVFAVMTPCGNPVKAENVVVEPKFSCDALTATPAIANLGEKTTFKISATAKDGAKVHDYVINYGDGTATQLSKSNTFSHTYAKAGTYKVKSSVRININGKVETVTSKQCETTVTIKEVVKPVFSCDALSATPTTVKLGEEVKFNTKVTAKNGATVKNYAYDFGDGTKQTTTTSTTSHTYTKPGSYTAKVTPSFIADGQTKTDTNKNCEATISAKANPSVDIVKKVNGVDHIVTDVNQPFVYSLTVTNRGDIDLKNVVVTDTPEDGVVLQSAEGNLGKITNNTWTYTIPELKKNASVTFKLTAMVTKEIPGKIINNACVDAPEVPGSPDDCDKATVEIKVKACNIETGVIEKVKPGEENKSPYTTDLSQCDKVKVCDTETKKIVTVTKSESKNDRYAPEDSEKCKEQPVTPPSLPQTGIADTLQAIVGLGVLTAASYYYVTSRRA